MKHPQQIVLIGPRATGKSTVGRLLASALGWAFLDADRVLEAKAGCSIKDIFAAQGEGYFRALEAATLVECLAQEPLVLATGGGVILKPENRDIIKASGMVVWLTGSAEVLYQRIQGDATSLGSRPNLLGGGLQEVIDLLAVREPLYRECAHLTIDVDRLSPQAVMEAILSTWTSSK